MNIVNNLYNLFKFSNASPTAWDIPWTWAFGTLGIAFVILIAKKYRSKRIVENIVEREAEEEEQENQEEPATPPLRRSRRLANLPPL